ncbi:MAG: hypothetical protein NTX49_03085 [Chlamydiae bacterium]|nr:hypothetical protein [Chlamydiota bacterium]
MATSSIPLHRPPLSSIHIEGDKAHSLLGREISLSFGGADHKAKQMITTVGEIYQRCQKALSDEFGPTRLIIRGSSVAHLFSNEPFSDIDIHATIDVTHLPAGQRVGKGYAFKWAVLKGISEIIAERFPPSPGGSKVSIPSSDILFEEENTPLCSSGAPYNVHTIRLPGNIPVEFTLFNIVNPVKESVRNYDFNSGSLELCIEDSGEITIHSSRPDIGVMIDEVTRKELTCVAADGITRKGICRYLSKLALSGYCDKDKELLHAMLEGVKSRDKGKREDKILATEIVEEIIDYFQEKGASPTAAWLSLWLLPTDNPFLKVVIAEAKGKLKFSLLTDPVPERQALATLVQMGKKAECCWYLLMQAKSARKVLHRGEESLQLEIPAYPMFTNTPTDSSVFVIVPIAGLKKFSESSIPQGFLNLLQEGRPEVQVQGAETKALLQRLCKDVLTKPSLYPALAAVIDRFNIKPGADFSKLFIEWVEGLSDAEMQKIPLRALVSALENIKEGQDIKLSTILSLLKRLHHLVGKEGLCSFDSASLQKNITFYTHIFFSKRAQFGAVSPGDEAIMLDFAKAHVEELCKKDKLQAYKESGERVLCERILSIFYYLYINKHVTKSAGILCARLCLELGYPQKSMHLLKTLIKNEESLDDGEIHPLFENLAESSPFEYATFLKENASVIKQKMAAFSLLIEPFFEKLMVRELSPVPTALFVDLIDIFYGEEERQKITKTLFMGAAHGKGQSIAFLEEICKRSCLSCRSFNWLEEMDKDQLQFLTRQSGFDLSFATDPEFTMAIITQAALVKNIDLVSSGSLHLARTDKEKCLLSLEALNSLRQDAADLSTLPASLKTLVQLLESHPGLIISNDRCRLLIESGLADLSIYLTQRQGTGKSALDRELLPTLQKLHNQAALYTIENPCWPQLWRLLEDSGRSRAIAGWVNPVDLAKTLPSIDPKGNILDLINSFVLDGPFVYEFLRQISSLPAERHQALAPLVQLLLKNGRDLFLAKAPIGPLPEAGALVAFVGNILQFNYRAEEASVRNIDCNLDICSLAAAYGDKGNEIRVLEYLGALYKTDNKDLQARLKMIAQPQKILFFLAQRAMERKDLSTLINIKASYREWGVKKLPSECFSFEEIDSLYKSWQRFLGEIFSDPVANKAFDSQSMQLQVLEFYTLFLADILEDCSSSPIGVKIKEANFQSILELIDFLRRKKMIRSVSCFRPLVDQAKSLKPDQQVLFATRFIYTATAILEMQKQQPIQGEELARHSYFLLFWTYQLMALVEPSGERVISRDAIMDLLEKAHRLYPYFQASTTDLGYCAIFIAFFEGSLSKREMATYHSSWMQSILSRKAEVHFIEVSEWVALTCRLNPMFAKVVSLSGNDMNWFKDKQIITEEYFSDPDVVKNFIEMIDLIITRFLGRLDLIEATDDILKVSAGDLLSLYSHQLAQGMLTIKSKKRLGSEVIRLSKLYVDTVIRYLQAPKSRRTYSYIAILLGQIAEISGRKIVFPPHSGLTLDDYATSLHLIARKMLLLTKVEYAALGSLPQTIKNLYENEKRTIQTVLSTSQIAEVEFAIYQLYQSDAMAGAGGAASSAHKH